MELHHTHKIGDANLLQTNYAEKFLSKTVKEKNLAVSSVNVSQSDFTRKTFKQFHKEITTKELELNGIYKQIDSSIKSKLDTKVIIEELSSIISKKVKKSKVQKVNLYKKLNSYLKFTIMDNTSCVKIDLEKYDVQVTTKDSTSHYFSAPWACTKF